MQIIPVSDIVFNGASYKMGRNASRRVMNDIQREVQSGNYRRFDVNDMQAEEQMRKTKNKASKAFKRETSEASEKKNKINYHA